MLEQIGQRAKAAEPVLRTLSTQAKNDLLVKAAEQLVADSAKILEANAIDMENGEKAGMSSGLTA